MTLSDRVKPEGMSDFGKEKVGRISVEDIRESISKIKIRILDWDDQADKIIQIINEELGDALLVKDGVRK